MTLYAGETVVVTHTASFEGIALDNTDVTSVNVIVYNSDLEEVISEVAMTWSALNSRWEYQWDTTDGASTPAALPSGTYRAKVTVTGIDGSENWEYKRIRLANNPVGD